jgi:hypothetical protein
MKTTLTLADYPDAMVHIACDKCGRAGGLSKARLIAEHGAAIPLPDLRHALAACPRQPQFEDAAALAESGVPGLGEMKTRRVAAGSDCRCRRRSMPRRHHTSAPNAD